MSAHSLRKKLQTDLEKAGINSNWIDQILGHELINSRDAYSLPTDEELKEAYLKSYPIMRIYPEVIHQASTVKQIDAMATILSTSRTQNQEPAVLEIGIKDIQTIKQALVKGYRHVDTVGNIRLYMKV